MCKKNFENNEILPQEVTEALLQYEVTIKNIISLLMDLPSTDNTQSNNSVVK